jgi:acyl-coenzyme A synthetase/AMP-(fatty) acid ligase
MVFDVSLMEMLLPLTRGARLILATDAKLDDPERLATLAAEAGVTIMLATPSAWRRLLAVEWQAPNLKAMFAGEPMDEEIAASLMRRVNQLWNAYGPTEATILATLRRLNAPSEVNLIGKPMANTETYVLDSRLQPVPLGVVAELCIGGEGLATGYLGRETLTKERFVPNPFTSRKDARIYRTGDLVRYTRNGDLQYICRNDDQIKLRGHRIELGEVEACLNEADGVRAAIAAVCEPAPGDRRLVAYVVLEEKALWNPDGLRMHLRHHLPGYMVPQHLVQIDDIPLGTSQKVDRDALTRIPLVVDSAESIRVEACTETEKKIYTIWHDLIKGGDFSVIDSIFDLGGDSLMITRIVNALRQVFPVEIEFRWVFEFPTVRDLAAKIDQVNSK